MERYVSVKLQPRQMDPDHRHDNFIESGPIEQQTAAVSVAGVTRVRSSDAAHPSQINLKFRIIFV